MLRYPTDRATASVFGADEFLSRGDANGVVSFLADVLGSTIAVTDSSAAVVGESTYEPFGGTRSLGITDAGCGSLVSTVTAMTTKFGWTSMLVGCVAIASAAGPKTFRIQDSVLLFGNYNEVWIVNAEEERQVRPPIDVKYNGGYFAFPSLSPRGEFVAWGFATESHVAWPDVRIRFALGVYSVAQQRWKTYGEFEMIGDASISPDGARVAVVAGQSGALRLQILDLARETFTQAASPRGLPAHAYLSWSPDGARISTVLERGENEPVIAIVDLATGQVRELTEGFAARWSPDGQWIAYYSTDDQCMLVRADGTGAKLGLKLKDSWFASKHFGWGAPVWSPDSRQLLLNVVKNDGPALDVVLLDVATGRTTTKVTSGLPVFGWARSAK